MSEQWPPQQYDPRQHQQRTGAPQAQYPPQPPQPQHRARKPHRGLRITALLVIVFAALLVIVVAVGGGKGGSFKATVGDFTVINPADLAVTIHVTNTGSSAATPTCTVQAHDAAYAYTGTDVATLQGSVAAGATTTYVDNVTITGQGAQYVTQVTVSC